MIAYIFFVISKGRLIGQGLACQTTAHEVVGTIPGTSTVLNMDVSIELHQASGGSWWLFVWEVADLIKKFHIDRLDRA